MCNFDTNSFHKNHRLIKKEYSMSESIRCTKCILPDTYPGIHFDNDGICNVCLSSREHKKNQNGLNKDTLDQIIKRSKEKSKKYDAIVGLSGGKDSSYVAYYLKNEYGLRMLGMNYDIGYRSPYAVENLENITNKLNIDLLTIRPNRAFLKKLFVHFLKQHGEFCSVCNNLGYLIGASLSWNQRLTLGFSPLMIGGWSKKYEFQQGVSVTSMQYFFENLSEGLLEELITQPFIEQKVVETFMNLKDPRQAQIGTDAHKKLGHYAMNFIQLPDYIDWNPREIPSVLSEKLHWKHPSDVHESHFDCILFPLKEYLKFRKYGLTQETIKNSVLIREGLMTREEAIQRIDLEQTTEPEILTPFFRDLGILKEEVNWDGEWSK